MVKKNKQCRALGYMRVSTSEQASDGVSLAVQRSKIAAYCELNDLPLIDVIEDAGISGKSLARPGIQEVIKRMRDGEANALVILKLDRLSRSTRDVLHLVETIEQNDWMLHSISERLDTSSASGRFTITILSALAQMEREQVSERTSQALQFKKANNEVLGGTPYGYTNHWDASGKRVLNPVEDEQAVLVRVNRMRLSGTSYWAIAEQLNNEGVKTKRGGKWYPSTVQAIVQRVGSTPLTIHKEQP